MEDKQMNVDEILKMMEKGLGKHRDPWWRWPSSFRNGFRNKRKVVSL